VSIVRGMGTLLSFALGGSVRRGCDRGEVPDLSVSGDNFNLVGGDLNARLMKWTSN
jgi:hypothetical protein